MNIQQKSNEFRIIVNQMADLYEKKNSNYGDSFGQLYKELGPTAGLVPLWNKLHRATSLIKGSQNNFESLEDTLKDLACYAIMNLIALKEQEPEEENKIATTTNQNFIKEINPIRNCDNPKCIDCYRRLVANGCDGCFYEKKFLTKGETNE